MLLRLIREPSLKLTTLGSLYVDGAWLCWSLEDQLREQKIPGETAIPAGHYRVVLAESPRFKRILPHLLDVPGFEGILIHSGNVVKDTHGCLLVGQGRGDALITQSRAALEALMGQLQQATDPIWIHIENPYQEPQDAPRASQTSVDALSHPFPAN